MTKSPRRGIIIYDKIVYTNFVSGRFVYANLTKFGEVFFSLIELIGLYV